MKKKKQLSKVQHTARGFELIEFKDHFGCACSLQASSLAIFNEPGTSAVWLGCNDNAPYHLGEQLSPRMHLSREQVELLVKHLQCWLKRGTFKL